MTTGDKWVRMTAEQYAEYVNARAAKADAWEEGYNQGRNEGYEEGYEDAVESLRRSPEELELENDEN